MVFLKEVIKNFEQCFLTIEVSRVYHRHVCTWQANADRFTCGMAWQKF